ncbi:MAG: dTDP-4-dehydrorhamnose reductase [Blastocatellia bacterium]|jgi:dTDP-4-dehydrorhamnose reductase|nr:dTDP-4-dehydrorhamnose reductase [Blastocatellia bacterium]
MTSEKLFPAPLELWAGVECTINRVGDSYSDQLERSGHATRPKDLDRLAALGVRTLRYPILWERTAPQALEHPDWSWADERMGSLRRLGLRPIVGLVHHGSGPSYTGLLDPGFPEKLAKYAGAMARRYPWVSAYTPVNEPLTTARFSCLYGHWYPHERDALVFARALLSQCRAIVLAMRAIRVVNPAAQLIQTEDLGKTFSTQTLAYQSEFENERRWLTFDLLCGRITYGTPMWDYLVWLGIEPSELEWFSENYTSPDLLGINHYITSERFLDQRLARYPFAFHGGNGRHAYADVEAVRVCSEGVAGPKAIMREVWERYGLPLAITEAHLGCTREEQLRWLNEIWQAAVQSRKDKVDVRAVTAWAAFGTYDWNNLLTANSGSYEPGIFDLRSPAPRPTVLSSFIETIAAGKEFDHPTLDVPGWWHRLDRLSYPPVTRRGQGISCSVRSVKNSGEASRPLLITGATGTLGQAFARICEKRGLAYQLLSRAQLDIADELSVASALTKYEPWALVNAAGYVRVDEAETNAALCRRENVSGPARLAKACADRGVPLVTFSSDLVFDGEKSGPYVESDATSPLNVYGASKAEAEARVLEAFPGALVIRTSAFFGPWDRYNFVHDVINNLARGRTVAAAEDISISPTYVPDLINAALDLLIDGEEGIWHLTNPSIVTWAEFARLVADMAGYDSARVEPRLQSSLGFTAVRPSYTPLTSERGGFMPCLEDSLARFFHDRTWGRQRRAASAGTSA